MEDLCPKCGARRGGEACPKCGLVFAKFEPAVLFEGVDPEVARLWEHVEARWDDKAAHALFVEQCVLFRAGGYAAACYRRKGDDPIAIEQLSRLGARLEESLHRSAANRPATGSGRKLSTILVVLIVLAAAAFALYVIAR